ncbi:hypothetical protein OS493_018071 [Desmophyllum pertusum]|uniref:Uncharacterized protein n=1 Tax=Desmophyllum pertusum TaxID=174260 RepID=A0A9W9YNB9_9CNID|nr:hypothetical protein OS493_018071 [Desmophyllum pertusum]
MTSAVLHVEKLTFAPVKKNAFKKRTAPGKFAEIRRKIFADQLEQVACRQQENAEALEMGFRPLGLLSPPEEMRISKVDAFSQRAEASTSEEDCREVFTQKSD